MSQSVTEIAEDIDRRRVRIDNMLSEIEVRLSPVKLTNQLFDSAENLLFGRDYPEMRDTAVSLLRRHPVPVAMIGVGLVWLGLGLTRSPGMRQSDTANDLVMLAALARNAATHLRILADREGYEKQTAQLCEIAVQKDRIAGSLQTLLQHVDLDIRHQQSVPSGIIPDGETADLPALCRADAAAVAQFRELMKHSMSSSLRQPLAKLFYEMQRLHDRLIRLDEPGSHHAGLNQTGLDRAV